MKKLTCVLKFSNSVAFTCLHASSLWLPRIIFLSLPCTGVFSSHLNELYISSGENTGVTRKPISKLYDNVVLFFLSDPVFIVASMCYVDLSTSLIIQAF